MFDCENAWRDAAALLMIGRLTEGSADEVRRLRQRLLERSITADVAPISALEPLDAVAVVRL